MSLTNYSPEDHLPPLLALLVELEDAEHLFYLGNSFDEKKDYKNAEKCYRNSLEFDPDYAEAHNNLGVLLKYLGRCDEAEEEYREAIRADPDHALAHSNLGILLKNSERYDEAEKEYREAIRIYPYLAEAHANLGILFSRTKRPRDAKNEFDIAKELFRNQGRGEDVKMMEELLANT